MTGTRRAGSLALAVMAAIAAAGCAESQSVRLNPVWSATVPADSFVWAKTVNVFPFYSVNRISFADRIEESGNILLFISWDKVTPKAVVSPAEPVVVCPVEPEGVEPSIQTPANAGGAEAAEEPSRVEAPSEGTAATESR